MSRERNKFIDIKVSTNPFFRYEAIMETPYMERYQIPFGDKSMKIYQDTTPLQIYKNDNTNSTIIREKNIKRIFSKNTNVKRFSPDWFDLVYLYSYL